MIQHVFFASEEAKENSTKWQRFTKELDGRGLDMLNNIVWGSVNLYTNFNDCLPEKLRVSDAALDWIVVAFLVFDVSLLCARWKKADEKFKAQWACLEKERETLLSKKNGLLSKLKLEGDENQKGIIIDQLEMITSRLQIIQKEQQQLQDEYDVTSSTYQFNLAAAFLLFVGYIGFCTVTGPAVFAFYAVNVLACAMYASDGAWAKRSDAKKKYLRVKESSNEATIQVAEKQLTEANREFNKTLAEKTLMPTLLLTATAICWQISLGLIGLYLIYKSVKWVKEKNQDSINREQRLSFYQLPRGEEAGSAEKPQLEEKDQTPKIVTLGATG